MLQFEIPENCIMAKVIISGNYYGSKTFPSLNNLLAEYGRHPKGGGAMKRKFEKICCDEIRMQLPKYVAKNPIILHYRFFEPLDGNYRDNMNIFSMADKCFEDALPVCKVIPNDNPKFMLNTTHDFFYLPERYGEPYFEVYIEEIDSFGLKELSQTD